MLALSAKLISKTGLFQALLTTWQYVHQLQQKLTSHLSNFKSNFHTFWCFNTNMLNEYSNTVG